MSSAPALVDHEQVRTGVDAALAQHLTTLAEELVAIGPDSTDLLTALRDMLTGGKRLRAAFCYWSWRAHGGAESPHAAGREQVLRVGAALELFQAAALFHDDVMDDSDTRRGRPAAHRSFAALHEHHGWSGPSEQFGDSSAILLGDLALIACEREFAAALEPLDLSLRRTARQVFDGMRTEVTVGQYLDVRTQALPWGLDAESDERRAREVIRAKSARYSVEHPLVLGAVLAGADDAAMSLCRTVGLPLGEAFQLRDDLLGVFGDPTATGKPAGDDLREGKRTVLVVRAVQAAADDERDLILTHLGRRDLTGPEVEAVQAAVAGSGAVESVEQLISGLASPALDTLAGAPLSEPGRGMLLSLGRAAVDRLA
jgi:geranylgeranyl diphosphate synthase type I